MPKQPDLAQRLFEAHLSQLKALVDRRGLRGVKKLYQDAESDLKARLLSVAPSDQSVSAVQLRALLAQTEAVLERLNGDIRKHLQDTGRTAAEMGATHGVREFKVLAKKFKGTTPILNVEKASVLRGMVDNVDSSLLRRHRLQSGQHSLQTVAAVERQLTVGAMTQKPLSEMVDELTAKTGPLRDQRAKAETIVRTEMSYAHNAGKHETLVEVEKEIEGPLKRRLLETFDDRTGDDSFLIHGQTVGVNEPFNWKRKVRGSWVIEQFMFPPNRPNDRSVVIPWDPEWDEDADPDEEPLTRAELRSAMPTRWRSNSGVTIPPGHRPGKPYR